MKESIFVILFFTCVSFLYLGANIFSGEIVSPMDRLLVHIGWKESGISTPLINADRSDILDVRLPVWINARKKILNGEINLWDPSRSGGTPSIIFLGNSFISVGFLIFLIVGDGLGFTLGLLAKLVIAGFGTYKLCRTQLETFPSIFGGLTYMMSGFNAGWLMWPHVETSIWIPWLLWAVIKLEERPNRKSISIVALLVGMLIFGGFMSVSAYGFMLVTLLVLWLAVIRIIQKDTEILKRNLFILSGIILGLLLTSIQVIPFIEWLKEFDTSWRQGGSFLNTYNLDTLWKPFRYSYNFNGNIVPKIEMSGYIGKITILFSLIALFHTLFLNKKKRLLIPLSPAFWIAVTTITIMIAFNFTLVTNFIYELPVFNNNLSNRLLVIIGLGFAIIGAYGFQKLSILKLMIQNSHIIILVFVFIIALQIIDLGRIGQSQNAVVSSETFYPNTPTINYIITHIVPGQSVIATSDAYMVPGTLNAYGIYEWYAHGYFKISEKHVLDKIVHDAWVSNTAAMFNVDQIDMNSELIDALSIRYILAPTYTQNQSQTQNNTYQWSIFRVGNQITIYENKDVPPGAYLIKDDFTLDDIAGCCQNWHDIKMINFKSDTQEYMIETNYSGWFIRTMRIWPGWKAYVNGHPVEIKPYLGILPAIRIDPGISIISLEYKPYSFFIGATISFITLLFLIFLYFSDCIMRSKK